MCAPPGGHLSGDKMAIEQNFSDICHLEIDHLGMGSKPLIHFDH